MAVAPIDMRRSFDGLCAAVQDVLSQNPLDGHFFVPRKTRRSGKSTDLGSQWTGAIWYKRLKNGKCRWLSRESASIEISAPELSLLLDAADRFNSTATPLSATSSRCGHFLGEVWA
jgi:transposase